MKKLFCDGLYIGIFLVMITVFLIMLFMNQGAWDSGSLSGILITTGAGILACTIGQGVASLAFRHSKKEEDDQKKYRKPKTTGLFLEDN